MDINSQPIIIWGKSLQEFQQIFNLNEEDYHKKILEIGFGPSSFNHELTVRGGHVISCHELFSLPVVKMQEIIKQANAELSKRLQQNPKNFIWKTFPDATTLLQARKKNFAIFLEDYSTGVEKNRYQVTQLPHLDFSDGFFDLALCANTHFGNLQDENEFNYAIGAILELCRVAHEIRIFPLLGEDNKLSPIIGPLMAKLYLDGFGVEIKQVNYELQKGGNAMMRVWATTCVVQ